MATIFTHTYVALALGAPLVPETHRGRFLALSVLCSTLPDADVVGFRLGIAYGDLLGHRGLSHSLFFALLVGLVVVSLGYRHLPRFRRAWWGMFAWFSGITATHGFFDALTDGGLGIAFFSPFHAERYFLPWTPLLVSPIGVQNFFTSYGWAVLRSEMFYIWAPATLLAILLLFWRMRRRFAGEVPR